MSSLLVALGLTGVTAWLGGALSVLNRSLHGGLLAPFTLGTALAGVALILAPLPVHIETRQLSRARKAGLIVAALFLFPVCLGLGIAATLLLATLSRGDLTPAVLSVAGLGVATVPAFIAAAVMEHRSGLRRSASLWTVRLAAAVLAAVGAVGLYGSLWGPHDPRLMNLAPLFVLAMGTCGLLYGLGVTLVAGLLGAPRRAASELTAVGRGGEQARPADGVGSDQQGSGAVHR